MDTVDELAEKLISAFEPLSGEIVLEQLAVPEDLEDREACVDLWVVSADTCGVEEQFVVRGKVSVPAAVALDRDAGELSRLFREELLDSDEFLRATTVAGVASLATEGCGVPSQEQAERN
jgi:hypothetical protein